VGARAGLEESLRRDHGLLAEQCRGRGRGGAAGEAVGERDERMTAIDPRALERDAERRARRRAERKGRAGEAARSMRLVHARDHVAPLRAPDVAEGRLVLEEALRLRVHEEQLVEALDDVAHDALGEVSHRREPGEVLVVELEGRPAALELVVIQPEPHHVVASLHREGASYLATCPGSTMVSWILGSLAADARGVAVAAAAARRARALVAEREAVARRVR
jgi:hypothetical protein